MGTWREYRTRQKEQAQDLQARAEEFLESVNTAASSTRSLYITFLTLGTYIGLIIANTTDEQLLKEIGVALPILNAKLSVWGFYTFVPWLFVLFHFNLLLQFYILTDKLRELEKYSRELLDDTTKSLALRRRLVGFPVVHRLAGHQHDLFMRLLFSVMIWITVVVAPLVLLMWLQIRFLPYHDQFSTWVQRTAVVVDTWFLLVLWPRIVAGRGAWTWWLRCWWEPKQGRGDAISLAAPVLLTWFLSLIVVTIPEEPWEQWLVKWLPDECYLQRVFDEGYKLQVFDEGYKLRLMSFDAKDKDAKDKLDKEGRSLIIVALVETKLHIRIFDPNGEKVVDKAENKLISGEELTALRQRLDLLPDEFSLDESSLSQEDKQEIIKNATSIAGHTHRRSEMVFGSNKRECAVLIVHAAKDSEKEDSEGYKLQLMSVDATEKLDQKVQSLIDAMNKLDKEHRPLIIVALVGTNLHILILDANGEKVVDKVISGQEVNLFLTKGSASEFSEHAAPSGRHNALGFLRNRITALKQRSDSLPDESSLSQKDKQEIIKNSLSIAGHTHSEKLTIAGFSVTGELRIVLIDNPSHELSKELEKGRENESRIVKLAASSLGLTLPFNWVYKGKEKTKYDDWVYDESGVRQPRRMLMVTYLLL